MLLVACNTRTTTRRVWQHTARAITMAWSCGSYAELHSPRHDDVVVRGAPLAPKALTTTTTARVVPTYAWAPQAAMGGHSAVAAKLLDYGAEVEAADSKGNTALHYAAACGMLLAVEV